MCFLGGCEYCTTKMLLCGLSGVLFSLILTWFLSTGKVGRKKQKDAPVADHIYLFTWNKDIQTYEYRLLEEIYLFEYS